MAGEIGTNTDRISRWESGESAVSPYYREKLCNLYMPDASLANIERWAAGIPVPAYAIDDQTAIKVIDGAIEVVSEGHWKRFTP